MAVIDSEDYRYFAASGFLDTRQKQPVPSMKIPPIHRSEGRVESEAEPNPQNDYIHRDVMFGKFKNNKIQPFVEAPNSPNPVDTFELQEPTRTSAKPRRKRISRSKSLRKTVDIDSDDVCCFEEIMRKNKTKKVPNRKGSYSVIEGD